MIQITIATLNFDLNGHVQFEAGPGTNLFSLERRLIRTKTLNQAVEITDRGFVEGDRTLDIVAQLSEEDHNKLVAILKNNALIRIAFFDGNFIGAFRSLALSDDLETEIQIFIKEVF